MKVKDVVKLMHDQSVDLVTEYGDLLACVSVDIKGNIYSVEGYTYTEYELHENDSISDIHVACFYDDTIVIVVKS